MNTLKAIKYLRENKSNKKAFIGQYWALIKFWDHACVMPLKVKD